MSNTKVGINYFPLDVHLDDKFGLIEAEFGLKGFAIVVKLFQKIYGQQGYYCEWTPEIALLFSREIGAGGNIVSEIVESAIRRGIFDQSMYKNYHILTSNGIQKRYVIACGRKKVVNIEKRYLLFHDAQKYKNVHIIGENVDISEENVYTSAQIKSNEIKLNEIKEKDVRDADAIRNSSVFDFYEQNFGMMPRYIRDCMIAWLDEGMEPDLIIRAMEIAVEHNVRKWSYADKILCETSQKGIHTLAEFEKEKRDRGAKRSANAKTPAAGVAGEAAKQGGYGTYL